MKIFETDIEKLMVELLGNQGFYCLSPESQEIERQMLEIVILEDRLRTAIDRINPTISTQNKELVVRSLLRPSFPNLIDNNETFHRQLVDGIKVEHITNGEARGSVIKLIDFDNIDNNEFVVCNQFTVVENNINKRPDVVLFINGIPLVVIELKNPTDENATVHKAFMQLQTYKAVVPSLFNYNSFVIASDGLDAKVGTISSDWSRFSAWKSIDGKREDKTTVPQLETLIKGMLRKDVLLDLIKNYIVYERAKKEDRKTGLPYVETVKKIASYHQYFAVKKAIDCSIKASGEHGDRKVGVVWHTQGSGKSLSMVFYAGKIVQHLNNPTVIVLTDRNDLDGQLFDTFAGCKQLLRQEPVQAASREDLKKLLHTAGGGIIFTTIQKFFPENGSSVYDMLSDRKNIVVIADEAHRSQYGFAAKINDKGAISYGFAKYIRDALPNASFIGFTGTPIEKTDANTPAVFGNYIDIYDIAKAIEDQATVRILYESRLANVQLKTEEKGNIDDEVASIVEGEESLASETAKAKWARVEAIVGHPERIKIIAKDIVDHFSKRLEVFDGKAMIVCMSRRIAVELYNEIIKLRPAWESDDRKKGIIKVIMTSASSDPLDWQRHRTTKENRKEISERFKEPTDSLKLVIVRDMWLTGFDAPCLHTMYIDKPMRGHTLMQAIARVNRVFKDKDGGLVVDYIGIASDLKAALVDYTESGGKGTPVLDQKEAVEAMLEKFEVVEQMFDKFDYKKYFKAATSEKMTTILEAQEHVLSLQDGKDRFVKEVGLLSRAFALSVPHEDAMAVRDDVGFFQAVKARLIKFEPTGSGKSDAEIDTAIKQIVDKAVASEGIVDIFDAAGIKKPDISILSDEFMAEIRGMDHKNLAVELLKKLLNDEIRVRTKKNRIQSKKLSEMLESAIKRYQNNLLTSVQVIEELIKLAKEIKEADKRGVELGLSDYELAFYDALANNQNAKEVLGDETLRNLARVLVGKIKANTAIDWTIKESVQARLRVVVKRTLNQYGYPPDQQLLATENVLKQAELFADELV